MALDWDWDLGPDVSVSPAVVVAASVVFDGGWAGADRGGWRAD